MKYFFYPERRFVTFAPIMSNNPKSPIIDLQQQQLLLRMEYEYEKEEFKRQTETMGVARKVKRGLCWYPVSLGRSYYNSLNQLVIDITRTENKEIEHSFEFGRPVCFFHQSFEGKVKYMDFIATVSFADEERMVVVLPGAGALAELQTDGILGVQLYFDETSYRAMFEALEDTIRAKDNRLAELRDIGNSVIVVEHDKDMMLAADYVIDMGPKAGRLGGDVVFAGTPREMLRTHTLTSQYLNGECAIEVPAKRREGNGHSLWLRGAKGNNLKNVDVEFPLGKLICVTGVSGSGKSTLINETLQPILSQKFYRSLQDPLEYDSIEGLEHIDKVVNVDQSPLGRTPRSNPATYTGVFSDIRNLFVGLPEAKIRGYKPGRFSFNVSGGRCEACQGNGYKCIEMNFLPDVYVPCEVCHGKRYNRETLEVRFKGKSIADVLDMTINRAVEFFENVPQILNKIKVIQEVGLGYIKLGQSSTTLSGGESQRVKLATELSKRDTGKTLYILDEPTTGLHFEDIRVLMNVLNKLVDKGNTVIVIEHNLDVIKMADYIIDMGPEGGKGGGELLSCGTPEEVAKSEKGYTPKFLREELGDNY